MDSRFSAFTDAPRSHHAVSPPFPPPFPCPRQTLVTNTPRTLKEVLPELMRQVIDALAGASPDRRATAARCLGVLVRKLGDRVLPAVIPILQEGLSNAIATTGQVRGGGGGGGGDQGGAGGGGGNRYGEEEPRGGGEGGRGRCTHGEGSWQRGG